MLLFALTACVEPPDPPARLELMAAVPEEIAHIAWSPQAQALALTLFDASQQHSEAATLDAQWRVLLPANLDVDDVGRVVAAEPLRDTDGWRLWFDTQGPATSTSPQLTTIGDTVARGWHAAWPIGERADGTLYAAADVDGLDLWSLPAGGSHWISEELTLVSPPQRVTQLPDGALIWQDESRINRIDASGAVSTWLQGPVDSYAVDDAGSLVTIYDGFILRYDESLNFPEEIDAPVALDVAEDLEAALDITDLSAMPDGTLVAAARSLEQGWVMVQTPSGWAAAGFGEAVDQPGENLSLRLMPDGSMWALDREPGVRTRLYRVVF